MVGAAAVDAQQGVECGDDLPGVAARVDQHTLAELHVDAGQQRGLDPAEDDGQLAAEFVAERGQHQRQLLVRGAGAASVQHAAALVLDEVAHPLEVLQVPVTPRVRAVVQSADGAHDLAGRRPERYADVGLDTEVGECGMPAVVAVGAEVVETERLLAGGHVTAERAVQRRPPALLRPARHPVHAEEPLGVVVQHGHQRCVAVEHGAQGGRVRIQRALLDDLEKTLTFGCARHRPPALDGQSTPQA